MTVTTSDPAEKLPALGTVENPAIFYDGANALLAYQVAPVDGGGSVVLACDDVFDLRILPLTVESLGEAELPARPWSITEITGSQRTAHWTHLSPRLWTLSFNDELIEIVFHNLSLADHVNDDRLPARVLAEFIASHP